MKRTASITPLRAVRACLLLVLAAVALRFFETFPNGWDQTEYAWTVRSGYLPHSPYIVYFLAGRLLAVVLQAPVALATLSLLSGLAVAWLLTGTSERLLGRGSAPAGPARWAATAGAVLAAGTFVFVRHSGTQEVYMFQCLLLVASAWWGARATGTRGIAVGGALAGLALSTHSGSLFVLPALAYLTLSNVPAGKLRAGGLWLLSLVAAAALPAVAVAALLPENAGTLSYLRGIAPSLSAADMGAQGFWSQSMAALFSRLTDHGIPVDRMPLATGPLGMSLVHLAMMVLGLASAFTRNRRLGVFIVLWMLPYFVYETALGRNVDWGVYVVYFVPAIAFASSEAVGRAVQLASTSTTQRRRLAALAGVAVVLAAVIPNGVLVASHWSNTERDRLEHFSAVAVAAMWARDNIARDAVLLQPRSEWNVNILPYYSGRQHVMRRGDRMWVFDGFGIPFTPLKFESFSPVTSKRIGEWIVAGRPVYGFEPATLDGLDPRLIDPRYFRWEAAHSVPLARVAANEGLPDDVRRRLAGREFTLYRARLVSR